jgi:hypothetical protein
MSTITVIDFPLQLDSILLTLWLQLSKIIPATNGVHDDHASELPSHPAKIKDHKMNGNGRITLQSESQPEKAFRQDEPVGDFGWGPWTIQGRSSKSNTQNQFLMMRQMS